MHILLMAEDDLFGFPPGESLLQSYGNRFTMSHAGSVAEGLDYLKHHSPDLVLLDMNIKDGPATAPLTKIRSTYPEVPILALTTAPRGETVSAGVNGGAPEAVATERRVRLTFYAPPLSAPAAADGETGAVLSGHDTTPMPAPPQNEPLLVSAMEQFPEAVMIMDGDLTIRYVNLAFEALFGYAGAEVTGKTPNLLMPEGQFPGLEALLSQSLCTDTPWTESVVCQKKDHSLSEVKFKISPIFDESTRRTHLIAVTQDVTGEKRLKSIAKASSLTDNLGSIFSGIRHEIGNPLNSIKMALTVLSKNLNRYPEATIQEFIERALMDMERMEALLKEFKNFSLFETPKVGRNRIDLLLDTFVKGLVRQNAFSHIAVHDTTPAAPPEGRWGYTDPQVLTQVLATLTDNAVEALESTGHPEISFRLTQEDGLLCLEVSDNGCGMTEEEQKNLFKPFYTSKLNGTGLGLVMVNKLLAKMDTTITIKSSPRAGTCVALYIPTERIASDTKNGP